MSETQKAIDREALDWLVRVNDPQFSEWSDWEAWLSFAPQNAEAYWRLAEDEAEITAALKAAPPRPAASEIRMPRRPPPARAWAAAAAIAAAVLLGVSIWPRPADQAITTSPGERRSITLADGTHLHLDASTRVVLEGDRRIRLDAGRVLAEVVHDDARPFVLEVDDAVLTDLGTAFDVTRLQDGLRVAVTEGVVRVDAEGEAVTLTPGEGLIVEDGAVIRRAAPIADAQAWRSGRLVYDGERLSVIAEDLTRALGRPVSVDPDVRSRRFTGSIGVIGPAEALRPRLELLLDVAIAEDAGGWRLTNRPRR